MIPTNLLELEKKLISAVANNVPNASEALKELQEVLSCLRSIK